METYTDQESPTALTADIPSATELLLDVLSLFRSPVLTANQTRLTGEAFGLSAVTMRAAISRLCERGHLVSLERGVYSLPAAASPARRFIRNWPNVLEEVVDWQRGWYFATLADPRSIDRKATAKAEKIVYRYGFRKWRPNFFVRPANLSGGTDGIRARIHAWAEGHNFYIGTLADIDKKLVDGFFGNWRDRPVDYELLARRLATSRADTGTLSLAEAAAETLGMGRLGVKAILADPRLPEPYGNRHGLSILLDEMRIYEHLGRDIWDRYLDNQS